MSVIVMGIIVIGRGAFSVTDTITLTLRRGLSMRTIRSSISMWRRGMASRGWIGVVACWRWVVIRMSLMVEGSKRLTMGGVEFHILPICSESITLASLGSTGTLIIESGGRDKGNLG